MEVAISRLSAVMIRASWMLEGISLSCHFCCYSAFFFLKGFFFLTVLHRLCFIFSLYPSFIPASLQFEKLHLFPSDTATHWSLYQHNSIECNLLAGNARKKQYGKVQLNQQILLCTSLSWSFIHSPNWWFDSNDDKIYSCVGACFVCIYVCVTWSCGWEESQPMAVEFKLLSEPVGELQAELFNPEWPAQWSCHWKSSRKTKFKCNCASNLDVKLIHTVCILHICLNERRKTQEGS